MFTPHNGVPPHAIIFLRTWLRPLANRMEHGRFIHFADRTAPR